MPSTEPRSVLSENDTGDENRRVLVTDPLDDAGVRELEANGCAVDVRTDLSRESLREIVPEYDAVLVRSGTTLSADVIEGAPRLSVIGRAGVGVDNIDMDAATREGILVANAPSGNTVAVAEHTLALLLSLAREIPDAHESLSRGEWNKSALVGTELAGRTFGIVGCGRIGRAVAERVDALGMDVIAYDPHVSEQTAATYGVELVCLAELLDRARVVSVHAPLTDGTRHLLGPEEFDQMRADAYLLHPARGGVVDEKALAEAVAEEDIAGAAVDVFENEPPAADNPLLAVDDVVVTPHIAAKTDNAMSRVALTIAENVVTALDGDVPENALNAPYPENPAIQEMLELGKILGRTASELADEAITAADVEYRGDIAETDTEPLTATTCVGLLAPVLDERVNRVSVHQILEERDIDVVEHETTQADKFLSKVILTAETEADSVTVAGTVTRSGEPYIVGLDGYRVEIKAPEHMIVFYGRDTPGVIGEVGTLLAEHGINIAGMYNSRETLGGEAIMVLAVDSPVSPELMGRLRAIENITDVSVATLT